MTPMRIYLSVSCLQMMRQKICRWIYSVILLTGMILDTSLMLAMETMISYASDTWHCPVVFYTNPVNDSTSYQEMVSLFADTEEMGGRCY